MHEEIAIAGSGGQGVLFIGRLLAQASLLEEREVVWVPSYGAAKRGGTAWCNVIISDEKIGTIFTTKPTVAIAMNEASLAKLEPIVKPGGLLIVNQSMAPSKVSRQDIRAIYIPANDLAAELGGGSASNLLLLGAFLAACPVVSLNSITAALKKTLTGKQRLLEANKRALKKGYARVQKNQAFHSSDRNVICTPQK